MSSTAPTPEAFARILLSRLKMLDTGAVDLEELTRAIGLKIREVDSDTFEGALVRIPNRPVGRIAVSSGIREPGRKRFTIGHEIGHYVLPGHGQSVCQTKEIESWSKAISAQELAANRFASELLMPTEAVGRTLRAQWATFEAAKEISNQFQTSLTAAAMKCMNVTDENCVLVVSDSGVIQWTRPSDKFRHYIPRGAKVSTESFASQLFAGKVRALDGAVPADVWLTEVESGKVWEDSIILPYYERVLTIVTIRPGDLAK
jgi:hypothetical protein